MADVINLRSARKQKERSVREQQAANNREKFGRSKSEKTATTLEAARAEKALNAHKRDE
jgi:hypothetical protein